MKRRDSIARATLPDALAREVLAHWTSVCDGCTDDDADGHLDDRDEHDVFFAVDAQRSIWWLTGCADALALTIRELLDEARP